MTGKRKARGRTSEADGTSKKPRLTMLQTNVSTCTTANNGGIKNLTVISGNAGRRVSVRKPGSKPAPKPVQSVVENNKPVIRTAYLEQMPEKEPGKDHGTMTDDMAIIKEYAALKAQFEDLQKRYDNQDAEYNAKLSGIVAHEAELMSELKTKDDIRRAMLNTILELRGSIRVFCRVRPLLSGPTPDLAPPHYSFPHRTGDLGETRVCLDRERADVTGQTRVTSSEFEFDHVFPPSASQDAVFHEVEPLVQTALDGNQVCIFAYGQTSSGKTFTMNGAKGAHRGIIPRAIETIFAYCEDMARHGVTFNIQAACLQIYNDKLQDLLKSPAPGTDAGSTSLAVQMRGDVGWDNVSGLSTQTIAEPDDIQRFIDTASSRRVTSSTQLNDESSRSHMVTRIMFTRTDAGAGPLTKPGLLYLVDLAGSERVKASGADQNSKQFKEATDINKSLSTLHKVLQELKAGGRAPFRDAMLTKVLMPALSSANGRALMIVNVNPEPEARAESYNSMTTASETNKVVLGGKGKRARRD